MMRYEVRIAPGCHGKAHDPVVSRHHTLERALDAARKSDRLYAIDTATGESWQIPQQNDRRLGRGRFGNGITRTEARALGWSL